MDYGKFKYENAQKAREARRNQTNVIIKEMKLRPKIDSHDYETKKGHVVRFLGAGDKVKITIMFRGREQHRPELGFRLLQRLAEEAELDLVEVAAQARPPVCKLMDYGKFKYENAQKARESRRNQTNVIIKEMKLRPKIDKHDYETKKGHVTRFLGQGHKVKVTIMFRGREQSRPELGFRLLQRLAEDVGELGYVEATPKQDGRNMTMVLAPNKKPQKAPRAHQEQAAAEPAPEPAS
jgi:translation initiation factor IF-3